MNTAPSLRRAIGAVVFMLLIPLLLSGQSPDQARAQSVVRGTLRNLAPPRDAVFGFTKTRQRLGHFRRPWYTMTTNSAGSFLLSDAGSAFYATDSTTFGGPNVYSSFTYCCDTTLAVVDYGDTAPRKTTTSDRIDFLYTVSTMTPVFLLRDFLAEDVASSLVRYASGTMDTVVYRRKDNYLVSMVLDATSKEVRSAWWQYADDMYGDVTATVTFSDYDAPEEGGFRFPTRIVERYLGMDANVVTVGSSQEAFDRRRITALIPPDYRIESDRPSATREISRFDYNDNIHFVDLKHANSRVAVVEFRDFLVVTGAPLNAENGELIVQEARRIAPGKPIRYFVFGHHHPHYLGGVRALVHAGATIVTTPIDTAYIRQLVDFDHKIEPDSLQLSPKPLTFDVFDTMRVISDGEMEMRLIFIGSMSKHTEDYVIYYFPREKMVLQDDLVYMRNDNPHAPAGPMQRGLYDAIVQHGLDVDVIYQSWMINSRSVKTVIPFDDLQQSIR